MVGPEQFQPVVETFLCAADLSFRLDLGSRVHPLGYLVQVNCDPAYARMAEARHVS